jgi:hypothetical protein
MADLASCDPAFIGTLALTLPKHSRSVPTASKAESLGMSIPPFLLGLPTTIRVPHVVAGAGSRLAHEAFRANRRPAAILATLAIDHVDTVDRAIPAVEIEPIGAVAAADHALHVEIIRTAVRIHHLESHDLDVAAPRGQPYGLEAALASPDTDRIAIPAAEGHLTAAKLDPPTVETVSITTLCHGIGHDRSGAHQRGQHRATDS